MNSCRWEVLGRRGAARRRWVAVGWRRSRCAARGFTLVEMMVVIVIIALISAFAMGALYAAGERARHTRTQALIRKLHDEMMLRLESYEHRRLPIDIPADANPDAVAALQVVARRELMRMELPDRYDDLFIFPTPEVFPNDGPELLVFPDNSPMHSALCLSYQRRIEALAALPQYASMDTKDFWDAVAKKGENQSAELLYLIMSTPFGDEEPAKFPSSMIGDTDGDGMPEFIDGWGNPIEWLRWPAGFLNVHLEIANTATPLWGYVTDLQTGDPEADPDPFNPRRIDAHSDMQPDDVEHPEHDDVLYDYRLVPLIVSPGPDGYLGLALWQDVSGGTQDDRDKVAAKVAKGYTDPYYTWQPTDSSLPYMRRGTPRPIDFGTGHHDDNGTWVHHDNIHNHLLDVR